MKVLLFLVSIAVGVLAVPMFMFAKSAITQASGAALFVAACVLFGAAAIIDAIEQASRRIELKTNARPSKLLAEP